MLAPPVATAEPVTGSRLDFAQVYDDWFDDVCRWVRAHGGLDADQRDLAQEVFLVVQRKLPDFDGAHLAAWLYRITARTVRDYRRSTWLRRLFARQEDESIGELAEARPGPEEELQRRESERQLDRLLARLSVKHRTVFVLFEIEGYSGEQVAELQGIPIATVWTRLHHARRALRARLERAQRRGGRR